MSRSEHTGRSEKKIVTVSKHGQATIPKRFREKLGIDAPGRVSFRETADGGVVVEPVMSPSEIREHIAANAPVATEKPATELLREKRQADKAKREAQFENEEDE